MTEKQRLRKRQRSLLKSFGPEARAREEGELYPRLLHNPLWREAELLYAYLPMPFEFRLEPLMREAFAAGKQVAVPRLAEGALRFVLIPSLDEEWSVHAFGMREPPAEFPELEAEHILGRNRLILVPGLAFDRDGYRLGFGGGYYDRFLSGIGAKLPKVGICYSVQLLDKVPREPHDQQLDRVIAPGL